MCYVRWLLLIAMVLAAVFEVPYAFAIFALLYLGHVLEDHSHGR